MDVRVPLIILCSILSIASLSTMISMSVITQLDKNHLLLGSCKIISCTLKGEIANFTYQWIHPPYYNATYQSPTHYCADEIECGLDDRWPEATFGGWLYKSDFFPGRKIGVCINGSCNLHKYPFTVAVLSGVPLSISIVGLLYLVRSLYKHREYTKL